MLAAHLAGADLTKVCTCHKLSRGFDLTASQYQIVSVAWPYMLPVAVQGLLVHPALGMHSSASTGCMCASLVACSRRGAWYAADIQWPADYCCIDCPNSAASCKPGNMLLRDIRSRWVSHYVPCVRKL